MLAQWQCRTKCHIPWLLLAALWFTLADPRHNLSLLFDSTDISAIPYST